MKIILVGATGTIGSAVDAALTERGHIVVQVGHSRGEHRADLADPRSLEALFAAIGRADAVVCTAGIARFGPVQTLTDDDYAASLEHKLMGQVNLVRAGLDSIGRDGSFTLTTGTLSQEPTPGTAAVAMVGGALESFVRAAALDLPDGPRINVVSPGWVKETMVSMGMDPTPGTAAAGVARRYVEAVEGSMSGETLYVEG